MEVGIKLWSSNSARYIDQTGFADFIEVLPVNAGSLAKFEKRKRKYVIHIPHEIFGFSPLVSVAKSRKLLSLAETAARRLKAELLIMHGGFAKGNPDEKTVMEGLKRLIRLAKSVSHGRLVIENGFPKGRFHIDQGKRYICYNYRQLSHVIEESGIGFCLDFEHAAITAHQLGLSYEEHIAELLTLKPEYFQLSGVRLSGGKRGGTSAYSDMKSHHTTIFDSDISPEYAKAIVKRAGKPICLETPLDIGQRRKEVEFLRR